VPSTFFALYEATRCISWLYTLEYHAIILTVSTSQVSRSQRES